MPKFDKSVSRIRFFADIPRFVEGTCESPGKVTVTPERCEYVLGLGPCGRVVTELRYSLDSSYLTVTQTSYPQDAPEDVEVELLTLIKRLHDVTGGYRSVDPGASGDQWVSVQQDRIDGLKAIRRAREKLKEIKQFTYKVQEITGRIETTHI
ncbi:hypothetical protein GWQ44_16190 [Pseudomonas sp. 3MA1]|uniref:hypothetical protein n=1 Tax=Pseudomonas sp. 3MA1 TaxID=2699196 RepID=UPI0023DD7207|nr:hypothetical protein [Pseudomonas sp. 3MA1]MDF2397087.1 hypothetical protein [Pseudomonas sp. 3MA1]